MATNAAPASESGRVAFEPVKAGRETVSARTLLLMAAGAAGGSVRTAGNTVAGTDDGATVGSAGFAGAAGAGVPGTTVAGTTVGGCEIGYCTCAFAALENPPMSKSPAVAIQLKRWPRFFTHSSSHRVVVRASVQTHSAVHDDSYGSDGAVGRPIRDRSRPSEHSALGYRNWLVGGISHPTPAAVRG